MARIKRWQGSDCAGYGFTCPGCGKRHNVWTETSVAHDLWGFNGDLDRPTFTPSILVTMPPRPFRCHSFVTEGRIQFLGDCTHSLAGQTVELSEIDT